MSVLLAKESIAFCNLSLQCPFCCFCCCGGGQENLPETSSYLRGTMPPKHVRVRASTFHLPHSTPPHPRSYKRRLNAVDDEDDVCGLFSGGIRPTETLRGVRIFPFALFFPTAFKSVNAKGPYGTRGLCCCCCCGISTFRTAFRPIFVRKTEEITVDLCTRLPHSTFRLKE